MKFKVKVASFLFSGIYPIIIILTIITLSTPSANAGAFISPERVKEIEDGNKVAVLFQITASDEDGLPVGEFFSSWFGGTINYVFLIGGFESGGQRIEHKIEFVDKPSMTEGWGLLYLDPGDYVINIAPCMGVIGANAYAAKFRANPLWELHLLNGEKLVYIGRLELVIKKPGMEKTIGDVLKRPDVVTGNEGRAFDLLKIQFPRAGHPVTRMLENFKPGPMVFHHPLPPVSP